MPKAVQIRDIDDEVYAGLVRRAGEEGITVPELLRREAAPLVVDVEVIGAIRAQHLRGRLDRTAAGQAVADLRDWPGERYGHRWLLDRAWELRGSVRGWDALYVALAEAFDATLLTPDERLARAHGPNCWIEVLK